MRTDLWTEEESAILRLHYRHVGGAGCAKLLPKRSPGACSHQAANLFLTTPRNTPDNRTPCSRPTICLAEYWESQSEDGRDLTGLIMGDPAYGRSALDQRTDQRTESKEETTYENGSFSDRIRIT